MSDFDWARESLEDTVASAKRRVARMALVDELRGEVERLSSIEFVHRGCEMIRRKDVESLIAQRDEALTEVVRLREELRQANNAATDAYTAGVQSGWVTP